MSPRAQHSRHPTPKIKRGLSLRSWHYICAFLNPEMLRLPYGPSKRHPVASLSRTKSIVVRERGACFHGVTLLMSRIRHWFFCFVSIFTRIIELFRFEVDDNETGVPSLLFIISDEFTFQLIAE